MITFPLGPHASLIILEPGNLRKIREGHPLMVGEHAVAFTPDLAAFLKALGVDAALPMRDERLEVFRRLTAGEIQNALDACKNLPEVDRP